jgi:hypothetical protein
MSPIASIRAETMPSSRIPKRTRSKSRGFFGAAVSKTSSRVKGKVSMNACGIEHSPTGTPSDELERLRRGELTAHEYLRSRIDQATLHLRGRVSSRRLVHIRKVVVDACATDPVLLAMQARLAKKRR